MDWTVNASKNMHAVNSNCLHKCLSDNANINADSRISKVVREILFNYEVRGELL